MAFERKYSDEVRDAAVRRVVERRQAEPGNRSILREVAEEFEVGEQNDLDHPDGLPAAVIRDLITAGTVVLATLWPRE